MGPLGSWHKTLRYKIHTQYQLPPLTIKLLSNFLQQRMARIEVDEYVSAAFNLESVVLQGSVLGPTLYSLYNVY